MLATNPSCEGPKSNHHQDRLVGFFRVESTGVPRRPSHLRATHGGKALIRPVAPASPAARASQALRSPTRLGGTAAAVADSRLAPGTTADRRKERVRHNGGRQLRLSNGGVPRWEQPSFRRGTCFEKNLSISFVSAGPHTALDVAKGKKGRRSADRNTLSPWRNASHPILA